MCSISANWCNNELQSVYNKVEQNYTLQNTTITVTCYRGLSGPRYTGIVDVNRHVFLPDPEITVDCDISQIPIS